MDNWRTIALEDLAAPIKSALATGPFGSAVSSKHFRSSGVPMLRGNNLSEDIGTRLDEDDLVFLDERLAASFARSTAQQGDLVFTCWGTIGQIGLIDANAQYEKYVVSNKQMKMSPDSNKVDSLFLYYYLSQSSMVDLVVSQAIGSSVPGFNLGQLRALQVRIPELGTQRAIVEVLGSLDEKVAANVKLANTAVKLVETKFAAAVCDLDFSGKTFADLAYVRGGGTPRTSVGDYWDGDVDWATPTDVTALSGPYLERTARRITYAGLNACASSLHPAGSILMTSRATVGAFAVAQRPTAVNQGFIVVNPHDLDLKWWIYHEMHSRVDEFISLANGATFLELSRGNFKKFRVRLAEDLVMKDFGTQASALHGRARAALMESSGLAATRDALLSQLMSGKIRVKDAEKTVEEVL